MQHTKTVKFIWLWAISGAGLVLQAYPAAAACVSGLPCVVPKTANDPSVATDGPNAPGAPNADKSEGAACDADFMNQIYSRAFLEASRENVMNEVIMRKPDSVMEYTCFDQVAGNFGDIADNSFSGSNRWSGTSVPIGGTVGLIPVPSVTLNVSLGAGQLANNVSRMVLASLDTYIGSSFSHSYLGGSVPLDYAPGTMPCTFMNDIFYLAKCNDIGLDDPFLSFRTLVTLDPRQLPSVCTGGTKIRDDIIDVSENRDFTYVNFDAATTYLDRFQSAPCLAPIPTGVTIVKQTKSVDLLGNVTVTNTAAYQDKVCPNPSCYYENGTDRCLP